jgi:hypothetical protein
VTYRYFLTISIATLTAVAILFSACRKINDPTELGDGLIPPVDNVNTFDTTITVLAFNDTISIIDDSIRLQAGDEHFLGKINADPFFGKTDARLFLQLKPPAFPYGFRNKPDSIVAIDSIVLTLNYRETYGDTNVVQTVNVYEIDQSSKFHYDSVYLVRRNEFTYSNFLGSRTFAPSILNDSVKAYGDTTVNQLRIRLDNSFGARLLSYDSSGNSLINAYKNDSIFNTKFKGFALQSMSSGDAVMGFDLVGRNTRLAIYYKYQKNGPSNIDTAVDYFVFTPQSANANYVVRDYVGTPLHASLGGNNPDPEVFIQNTPGTYARLKIPDLATLSNRVIHRAELIVEQKYDIKDTIFRPVEAMYLDAIDPSITRAYKYRAIPYDLNATASGPVNLNAFGAVPKISIDPFGNKIRTWRFNISRYVQHVLTQTQSLYDLRLSSQFFFVESYGIPPGTDFIIPVFLNSAIVKGRVRLHGNTGTGDNNPQRIRLRLVYSKL